MRLILLTLVAVVFTLPLSAMDMQQLSAHIFTLTNAERAKAGLPLLTESKQLDTLALMHSDNMIKHRFYSHTDHEGFGPQERKAKYARGFIASMGENIISASILGNEKEMAATLVQAWMRSPGHRANILSRQYTHLGVGSTLKEGKEVYATQNFAFVFGEAKQDIPLSVKTGTAAELAFRFTGTFPKDTLSVFYVFPDKRARYTMPDGRYYNGVMPVTPVFTDDGFAVTLPFSYGAGNYLLQFGRDGRYHSGGVLIRGE